MQPVGRGKWVKGGRVAGAWETAPTEGERVIAKGHGRLSSAEASRRSLRSAIVVSAYGQDSGAGQEKRWKVYILPGEMCTEK